MHCRGVKYLSALVTSILATCSISGDDRVELMDAIEAQVVLPGDARPLAHYARFYFAEDRKFVVGVYRLGDQQGHLAGSRTWVADYSFVPTMLDGGCSTVTVRFDRPAGRITLVQCNGLA
jgi:hypothetical protein